MKLKEFNEVIKVCLERNLFTRDQLDRACGRKRKPARGASQATIDKHNYAIALCQVHTNAVAKELGYTPEREPQQWAIDMVKVGEPQTKVVRRTWQEKFEAYCKAHAEKALASRSKKPSEDVQLIMRMGQNSYDYQFWDYDAEAVGNTFKVNMANEVKWYEARKIASKWFDQLRAKFPVHR